MKSTKRKSGKEAAVLIAAEDRIEMRIGQVSKGELSVLDTLIYPIMLLEESGNDQISSETTQKMIEVLNGYKDILDEYGIENVKAYYTRALADKDNSFYVFGQLKGRTGIEFSPLSDSKERSSMTFHALHHMPEGFLKAEEHDGLLITLGENESALTRVDRGEMRLSRGVPLTVQTVKQTKLQAQETVENYGAVVEEYVASLLSETVISSLNRDYGYVILHGPEVEQAAKICGAATVNGIPTMDLQQVHDLMKNWIEQSDKKLESKWKLPKTRMDTVYAVLMVLDGIYNRIGSKKVYISDGDLIRDFLELELIPKAKTLLEDHTESSILGTARELALRFRCDEEHADYISACAMQLFDKLKRIHLLDKRWRVYLKVACLLHDCGIFVGEKGHEAAHELISALPLNGLSENERNYVAGILDEERSTFEVEQARAIFLLADSLDVSRMNKFSEPVVRLDGSRLTVTITGNEEAFLEKRSFAEASVYFNKIYGITPVLQIHTTLL